MWPQGCWPAWLRCKCGSEGCNTSSALGCTCDCHPHGGAEQRSIKASHPERDPRLCPHLSLVQLGWAPHPLVCSQTELGFRARRSVTLKTTHRALEWPMVGDGQEEGRCVGQGPRQPPLGPGRRNNPQQVPNLHSPLRMDSRESH